MICIGRKMIPAIIIVMSFLAGGVVYASYRLYMSYKNIRIEKERYGVGTPSKGISKSAFIKGNWKGVIVDSDISYCDGAHNLIPYDLDNDGKIELIANSYRSDTLLLYKYEGDPHKPLKWERYVIDSSVGGGNPRPRTVRKLIKSMVKRKILGAFIGVGGAHYTAIADINNDGRKDLIVAGDLKNYDIIWYETPRNITDRSAWIKHSIYRNDSHRTYHLETGDIDGDGDIDIVFTTKTDNSVGWLENNGPSDKWRMTWVHTNCVRCFNARVADINKDGKMDIITSEDDSPNGGIIHLYRFMDNPREEKNWIDLWIAHFPPGEGVSVFEVIDIDKDGDLDIATANHQGDIYILENDYPNNLFKEWNRYKVTASEINSGHDFREIDVGDIDTDKDLDIVVADEGLNQVLWFENDGRPFYENWQMHIVDNSDQYLKWCHSIDLEDIDGDGDLDIAVAVAASNVFLWYSNENN